MRAVTDDLAERLCARTLELVDIPSQSRDEAAIAAHVLRVLSDTANVDTQGPVWVVGGRMV